MDPQDLIKRCNKCLAEDGQLKDFLYVVLIQIQSDYLLCHDCLEHTLAQEQKQMKRIQEQYIFHKEFQSSLNEADIEYFDKDKQLSNNDEQTKQLAKLLEEQAEIKKVLNETMTECRNLKDRVYIAEQEEQKFWESINRFEKRTFKLQEKALCAKSEKLLVKDHLDTLTKTSIVQIFFNIKIEDNYSQIYGLTIGKKPDQNDVNWDETNSGIAHLLLGYNYLMMKYGITYTRIQDIKIKGTLSQIMPRNSSGYYSVCYSKENEKIFGNMMEILLQQLYELNQHIQEIQKIQYSQDLKLPFPINKKEMKILDLWINPSKCQQKNRWAQWTKAMRYFMIDFKHLLTISSLSDPYL